MSQDYDPDLFRGTAEYYWRFRAPYAPEALAHVVDTFGLGPADRVLDLGCGPGILTLPLAEIVKDVIALDPDPEMLAQGRQRASAAGLTNIEWRQAGSREVASLAGPFKLVAMGQSFHWMDRDQVLADLHDLVEDGGGLAMIAPGERRPQESTEAAASAVVRSFLGAQPWHPQRNREPRHEPALRRSKFEITDYREFTSTLERDVESVIGNLYSTSGAARRLFGERAPAFEAAVREAMLALNPSGVFQETLETGVLIAMKR